ncbi:hypothetical protein LPJ53_002163 [Coemansia erecta]|uniref:Uncharacterized protein n=1 Tax=Coemansia erecta TaxID=147472 RepID=A0A9W8CTB7_9FUNG|nr:hypothetical protein LPJ53_002163 [Coemansia erecta]
MFTTRTARIHSFPGAQAWRAHRDRHAYATLVNQNDTDEVTDLYAGDDLVSAAFYEGKEHPFAGVSRCSTSQGPVLAGGIRDYDDCWSSLTIHEARNLSLDAGMGYRPHLDSDVDAGHKQTFERRTHELRRRARRRISDAFAKARNGWELLLLAFLQGRRTGMITSPCCV